MNLLRSITRATAAVLSLSPRPAGMVELSRLRRPRGGSIGGPTRDSCFGSVKNGSTCPPGESYRLLWYPRFLPPLMPGSASGAAHAPPRSSTPCSPRRGRRAGQGPRSGFPSNQVHQLEDELERVKSEMASMAAAATMVVSAVTPAGVGGTATSAGTRASSNASPLNSDGRDLLSHGLPACKRRSTWGAWAALAHPER